MRENTGSTSKAHLSTWRENVMTVRSFRSKAIHRIDPGSLQRLRGDCEPGDNKCCHARCDEVPNFQRYVKRKARQPLRQHPIAEWKSEEYGDQYHHCEILR